MRKNGSGLGAWMLVALAWAPSRHDEIPSASPWLSPALRFITVTMQP